MSIISIILRCDETGCVEETDATRPHIGWMKVDVPIHEGMRLIFDYCPDHAIARDEVEWTKRPSDDE